MLLRQKTKIYFADFETLTIKSKDYEKLNHTDVWLWYIESIDQEYEQGKLGNTLDDFMKYIMSDYKSKIIYFHNLSFDGNFIYKWLLRKYPDKFKYLGSKKPKGTYWEIFKNGNKYYSITLHIKTSTRVNGKPTGVSYNIKFLCTFNLLSSSIDALGKSLNIAKIDESEMDILIKNNVIKSKEDFYNLGSLDWNNIDPIALKAFISYIKRDVKIAKMSYINFEKNIYSLEEVKSKKYNKQNVHIFNTLTIASLAQKLCKNHIKNNEMKEEWKGFYIRDDKKYDLAKNFYGGGFTQFNTEYQDIEFNENGVGIDINSSYPKQMTKLLPYGELQETKPEGEYLEYYEVDILDAQIKRKYKSLICMKNWIKKESFRYITKGKNFKAYYMKEEWEIISKIYDVKVKSIKTYYAKASYWLSDFINTLYHFKEHYKKIGQDANSVSYKILLNSLYGSFCKRKAYDVVGFFPEKIKNEIMKGYKEAKENNNNYYIKFEDTMYFVSGDTEQKIKLNINNDEITLYGVRFLEHKTNSKLPNVLIGATITAYGRVQLLSTILELGAENFIYCDTDSIFIKNYDKNKIANKLDLHNTELGKWSLDFEFEKGKILGAKRYAFQKGDKVKFGFCGIHKSKINKDNWDLLLQANHVIEEGVLERTEDDYGVILVWKDYETKIGKH